jgi:hypothetical protein
LRATFIFIVTIVEIIVYLTIMYLGGLPSNQLLFLKVGIGEEAEGKRERRFWEWLLFRVRMLYYIGRLEEDRLSTIYLLNNKHNHSYKMNINFI